ncbi:MAG: 50S ribosomal protein L18 [Candidatus Bathyarchaeia archaeon]
MAKGPSYRVPYRRRRKRVTDYSMRRILASSEDPRLVFRSSNSGVQVQIIRSEIMGDHLITQANSKELMKKFGWLGGTKNTPTSYLVGFLAGVKALKDGIMRANLDKGLGTPTKGSKVFAAVKGAIDAGLEVPCSEDVLPSQERIEGKILAKYIETVLEQHLEGDHRFSIFLSRGLESKDLVNHFRSVKSRVEEYKH